MSFTYLNPRQYYQDRYDGSTIEIYRRGEQNGQPEVTRNASFIVGIFVLFYFLLIHKITPFLDIIS
jgi:hypothetical protein